MGIGEREKMRSIGCVIEEYRCRLGMSRKELSENICTEKYVYLIEKGKRSPSADMVSLFEDKLGVDLFDHYQYMDCVNPIAVREKMNQFNMYRVKSDFTKIKEATDIALDLPDFHCKPWVYEVEVNKISFMVFVEQRYDEAIIKLNSFLNDIEPKYSMSVLIANAYILLSSCYQLTGDLLSAKGAVASAYEIVSNKNENERYEEVITSVRISSMTMHYLFGEFHEVIHEGRELFQYQYKLNSYERAHYTFFYLAFAYYKTGVYDEAIECFKKGFYLLLIDNKPMDVYYLTMQDLFYVLLNDSSINQEMINEFKNKYNLS